MPSLSALPNLLPTLAAAGSGSTTVYYILLFLFVLVALFLMLIVLVQKGRGGGLASAFGGVGGNTAFGTKTGDVLTWATAIVFGIFVVLAVVMNLLANSIEHANKGGTSGNQNTTQSPQTGTSGTAPTPGDASSPTVPSPAAPTPSEPATNTPPTTQG